MAGGCDRPFSVAAFDAHIVGYFAAAGVFQQFGWNAVTAESVELERGWTVAGFNGHVLVADVDAHRLGCVDVARMFQKTGWSERWCTRRVHAVRTFGEGLRCPAVIMHQRWSGQTKAVGISSRWTAVRELGGQLTFMSAHLPHKSRMLGEFETVLAETQDFIHERSGQHLILGGDFNASFYRLTDFHHVGESIPRPRTLTDTKDAWRAGALHAIVAELDLTVTNTRMDASSKQERCTRSSWRERGHAQTQMDFIMVSWKLEAKQIQVTDFDCFKTDHMAVIAVLSLRSRLRHSARLRMEAKRHMARSGHQTLTDWTNRDALAAPALGDSKGAQRGGDQG